MKQIERDNSETLPTDRSLRCENENVDKNAKIDEVITNNKKTKFGKYGLFLILGTLSIMAISVVALIATRSTHNPILFYVQGIFPPPKEPDNGSPNSKRTTENKPQFIEKNEFNDNSNIQDNHFISVSDLYFNRLLATPLSKMSLTIPINDELIRSYQIQAIDYSKSNDMTFHLSLQHSLKINNDSMVLYDEKMNVINKLPTYIEEENSSKSSLKEENLENNMESEKSLEGKLRKNDEGRRLQQKEYYNYTSTTEWSHKPQVVNNIIPTYYPRNPYVPPYGNPYYYAPNILVPFVYIY
ncbi:hypothetical protein FG386_001993 [Cryptosporidium ryanae]|uniref:uncharacterized protein n=1 Tax=Cryptosporidium ryanae TaxID=515981 RepID=UPI003519E5FF|nr:hypothetical protein FG386_001993 [Cryptosporidium ryanae]